MFWLFLQEKVRLRKNITSFKLIVTHRILPVNSIEVSLKLKTVILYIELNDIGGSDMDVGTAVRLKILSLCKERRITINRLSYLCGITQSTLQNIIGGRNKSMTVSTLKKICDGLEITLRDFFDDPLFSALEQEIK